jgi:hypothetical protein
MRCSFDKSQIQKCGKSIEMVGFADMGQDSANLSALLEGKNRRN